MDGLYLFVELDRVLRASVVVWMGASPGAGKTALVASYLKARHRPAVWYRMDDSDRDVGTFWRHLALEASRIVPEQERLHLQCLAGAEEDGLNATTNSIEQFFQNLPHGTVLVLEDWVASPEQFQNLLRAALDTNPGSVSVIVMSRDDLPPALAHERSDRALTQFDSRLLRLSSEEALALAGARLGSPSPEAVSWLNELAGGWVAGFVMMCDGLRRRGTSLAMCQPPNEQAVFDYLNREVFERQPGEDRKLLLRVAVLPVVTPRTIEALTGSADGEPILARWRERLGSFLGIADDATPACLFSPIFRRFLLEKGRDALAPHTRQDLMDRRTHWLAAAGRFEGALDLIIMTEDWSSLEEFLAEVVPSRLAQGDHGIVMQWFRRIPPTIVEARAGLCYWLAAAHFPSALAESRRWYERAYAMYSARQDAAGRLLSWAAIVETIFLEWGDFSMLRNWIGVGEGLFSETAGCLMGELEQRAVAAMFCALMHGQPDHPQTGVWAQRLFELLRQIDDDNRRLLTGVPLFIYYTKWLGELGRAEIVLDMLRPPPERSAQLLPLGRILLGMAECVRHWHRYAIPDAMRAIQDAIKTAERSGFHLWDFLLHAQPVYAGLSAGDHRLVERHLNRLRELLPRRAPLEQAHYHYLAGWQAMLVDDPPRALEHLNHCRQLATADSAPMQHALTCIALMQAHHALGENEMIPPLLADARRMAHGAQSPLLEFLIGYVEAIVALDVRDETACLTSLRKALALARRHDYVNFAWCLPKDLARICVKALESDIEADFIRRLIRLRSITPDIPPLHLERWPWQLKIYTLGRFTVVRDGEPLRFGGKVQRKPLELLKALIALGGRDVPEVRLSEALWPEAEGDNAHSAFTTTLQRLRRLIGEESLLFRDGRLTLDVRRGWVDIWVLQRLLGEAENAPTPDEAETRLHKALDLYHGPLLAAEDDAPWLHAPRQRLRERIARLVVACRRRLKDTGRRPETITLGDRLLSADPAARELLQRAKMPGSDF